MKEAYRKLKKQFEITKLQDFQQFTKNLINAEVVITQLPKLIKQTKFLGLF